MEGLLPLVGLFGVAFVSATVLPGQSEAAMVGLLLAGYPMVLLVVVASVANTLGAVVNWAIGRGVRQYRSRRWFPVSVASLDRASGWYGKWGRWSLLFSWAPIGGGALTVAAGVLREPLWSFLTLVAIAKTGRYIAVAATVGLVR